MNNQTSHLYLIPTVTLTLVLFSPCESVHVCGRNIISTVQKAVTHLQICVFKMKVVFEDGVVRASE